MSMACLENLPNELLNKILTYLDIETIVFHFRFVCKRFHAIARSNRSYDFDFEHISKARFDYLCGLISPEHVRALTLSNRNKTHGQIPQFLSLFDLAHFTRLRSLRLYQVEPDDLLVFLNSIAHLQLHSLRIDCQTFTIRTNTALERLSSAIEHVHLTKLDLNLWPIDLTDLQWPVNITIRHLRIRNSLPLALFHLIMERSPCLKTLIVKDFDTIDTSQTTPVSSGVFPQLTTLCCIGGRIQMDKLIACLSSTPSLVHLKLIGDGNLVNSAFDGRRWEQLIREKLPLLTKFEIHIGMLTDVHFDTNNIEKMIARFRTPFWLEEKRCAITCDHIGYLHRLVLYSLPVCHREVEYCPDQGKFSASNYVPAGEPSTAMDYVNRLNIELNPVMKIDDIQLPDKQRFRNVHELTLGVGGEWPENALPFLSSTMDLSRLTKLSLYANLSGEYTSSLICGAKELLKQAVNVRTVSLLDYQAPQACTTTMETVCMLLTPSVQHLRVRVKASDDVKFIVENLEQLSSVTFEHAVYLFLNHDELFTIVSSSNRQVSKWQCHRAFHVWFD